MSLINQQGMYQSVPALNPLPYVNIAINARNRKAAREQAIDQYYQKLPDTINDKGVRDQEIPIINEGKNKIFEFGVRNREALRNPKVDNGAAQLTLDKMVRELSGVARLSQDAAKDDLEIGKIRLQKGNEWVVDDDEFLADNELHNLPVTDPRFKKIDINKVLQGRPFDEPSFAKDVRGRFKYTYGTPKVTDHPDDPLLQVETPTPILPQEEKNKIYAFSAETYHKSPKFRKTISANLAGTGTLQKLNDISKQVFGKEIEDDEDIAAAYTVSKLLTPEIKPKVRTNIGDVMDKRRKEGMEDWKIKQQISDQYKSARIRLNNEGRIYEIDNVPVKLRSKSTTLPVVLGHDLGEVVDVTNWSAKELDDVLGADKNKYGIRNNKPFVVGDKQYIKITPEGFKFLDAGGKVVAVEDKDVIINTNKRTQGLEKPVGTGKVKVRGGTATKQKGELDDL